MSAYVVEVRLEAVDLSDTIVLYGPFRSPQSALRTAEKIGKKAGLNHNTWGYWAGTDGGDLFAFVKVRSVLPAHSWSEAAWNILRFFGKASLGVR